MVLLIVTFFSTQILILTANVISIDQCTSEHMLVLLTCIGSVEYHSTVSSVRPNPSKVDQ